MSDAVEPLNLDQIEARHDAWCWEDDPYAVTDAVWPGRDDGESPEHYMVREDLPALLAEVDRLRAALATARRDALIEAADAVKNDETAGSPSIRALVGSIDGALMVESWLRARAAREEGR